MRKGSNVRFLHFHLTHLPIQRNYLTFKTRIVMLSRNSLGSSNKTNVFGRGNKGQFWLVTAQKEAYKMPTQPPPRCQSDGHIIPRCATSSGTINHRPGRYRHLRMGVHVALLLAWLGCLAKKAYVGISIQSCQCLTFSVSRVSSDDMSG